MAFFYVRKVRPTRTEDEQRLKKQSGTTSISQAEGKNDNIETNRKNVAFLYKSQIRMECRSNRFE